ncbi:hypothetical protein PACTADRAFT_43436 [Pachysolen tannophilus NRRL Y-2460]|uniref:Endoplasmic oxidoreductin n=1 Tax=Pachysolen tannophilus NRRL Y-2460 TaxID=669874 RepID=A0A1E4TT70_PACTA|nr:hypothetical protein PACTADRAFT_43436 [Pachysolen tannophilus NRRL Y-2460]
MRWFHSGIVVLLLVIITTVSGIKPPVNSNVNANSPSLHEFRDSPFNDIDSFHNSVIEGSSDITFQQIDDVNTVIRSTLKKIVNEPFFKIFKLNLYKSCPFWKDEGFCLYRSCAVDTINDWSELPEIWQPENLGKLEKSKNGAETREHKKNLVGNLSDDECIDEIKDNDYCEIDGDDDEDCVYVNLVDNPERFTGYGGEQSFQIWKAIYEENCFYSSQKDNGLDKNDNEIDQCIEKQIFYKLVSGMHSSISTHLTNEYLNLKTKEYEPNLLQFMFKVGNFRERLENMYLNYILVVKSLIKIYQFHVLDKLSLCGPEFSDKEVELKEDLKNLIEPFLSLSKTSENSAVLFDEDSLFQESNADELKNEFKTRFRNVSSIMDCVHCERCRLWGKLQTIGYGTSLKILFELNDKNLQDKNFELQKIELIALINTFDRLSKGIESVMNFESMFIKGLNEESLETGGDDAALEQEVINLDKDSFRLPSFEDNDDSVSHSKKFDTGKADNRNYGSSYENSFKNRKTLKESFSEEIENVKEALKLIWFSYTSLPRIIYSLVVVKLNYYWNMFIGRSQYYDANQHFKELFTVSTTTHRDEL